MEACADVRSLKSGRPLPPKNPSVAERIESARRQLDRARALRDAKRLDEARKAAAAARQEADATGFVAVRAEAAFLLGSLLHSFDEPGAVEPLQDAARLAASSANYRLAADAAAELIGAMADGGQAPTALQVSPLAEVFVVRAGDCPEQRGAWLTARGAALVQCGKYAEGRAALAQARTLLTKSFGDKDPRTFRVVLRLARAAEAAGDYKTTAVLAHELLATSTVTLGPTIHSPAIRSGSSASSPTTPATTKTARERLDKSLAIAEKTYGRISLRAALPLNTLGALSEAQGRYDAAERYYGEVLRIRRQIPRARRPGHRARHGEPRHPAAAPGPTRRGAGAGPARPGHHDQDLRHRARRRGLRGGELATILGDKGELAAAREHFQRSIAIWNQIEGPEVLDTLYTTGSFARFYESHGMCAEARKLAVPASRSVEKVAGLTHPLMADLLRILGAAT